MNKIIILVDYRNQFWLSANHKEASYDVNKICDELVNYGYSVEVKHFSEIDLNTCNFKGNVIVYQSEEDPNLFYHSYIEDILLGLEHQGAILIPEYTLFKCHHNKSFMEIYRSIYLPRKMKTIFSRCFGAYEEYYSWVSENPYYPHVIKSSEGCQSKNVIIVENQKQVFNVKKLMKSYQFCYWLKDQIKPYLKKIYPNYRKKSHYRRKIVIQNFIEGLSEDYKVLIFWDKVYVLKRQVRKNDFRASGSGIFNFVDDIPSNLLDFAEEVFANFRSPFISMDIAYKDSNCHLIEFQFVHFGTYTLEHSSFYFKRVNGIWKIIYEQSDVEFEFARSINEFLNKNENPLHS